MSLEFFIHTLIEFGPLTLFFVLSFLTDFYSAALGLVIATCLALLASYVRYKRFALFTFSVSSFILICGSATVYFHDPRWIVIEYTVSNLAFAGVTLVGWYYNRPVLKDLFGHMFLMSEKGWMLLTFRWGLVFLITGIMNQVFWEMTHDENAWTLFRLVSTIGIFIFGLLQFGVSKRERLEGSSPWGLSVRELKK
ncbi:MAG: septation protein IspZ [Minisyncoccia bacterium]